MAYFPVYTRNADIPTEVIWDHVNNCWKQEPTQKAKETGQWKQLRCFRKGPVVPSEYILVWYSRPVPHSFDIVFGRFRKVDIS